MIRLAIAERSNIWNESFDVVVNGNVVSIPAEGSNGFDEDNRWLFSREVEVPLEYLIDGNNEVYVDFNSTGGQLVTSSLVLSNDLNPRVLGDFDGDGDVDLADLDAFNGNLGMPPAGSLADLDLDDDGDIDSADLQLHYSTLIETSDGGVGTLAGDLNLDGIVDVLNDAAALVNNIGLAVNSWALGDIDGDGFVTVLNNGAALVNNLGQSNNATTAAAVPEPGGLMLIVLASTVALARRHR
jgi:hypothetical protein